MPDNDRNEFYVTQIFSSAATQTLANGHVVKGTFRTGEWVTFRSSSGMPLMALLSRIGSVETPLNVVREGQHISMVIDTEPENLSMGATLLAAGDDDTNMTTTFLDQANMENLSEEERTGLARFREIEEIINKHDFHRALKQLEIDLRDNGDSAGVHRLLARIYLEGDSSLRNKQKALKHIQQAYDANGAHDAAVWEMLAHVLAANGEVERGLRFLERLYAKSLDTQAIEYYRHQIELYRTKHRMPDVWEIIDELGALVFEAEEFEKIKQCFEGGQPPKNAKCRKNRCGKLLDIQDAIAEKTGNTKLGPGAQQRLLTLNTGIGAVSGLAVGIILGEITGQSLLVASLLCGTVGAGVGAAIAKKSKLGSGQAPRKSSHSA